MCVGGGGGGDKTKECQEVLICLSEFQVCMGVGDAHSEKLVLKKKRLLVLVLEIVTMRQMVLLMVGLSGDGGFSPQPVC